MNKLTVDVLHSHNVAHIYRLTLFHTDRDKVVIELDQQQMALMKSRAVRTFLICCRKEMVLDAIENAKNNAELEVIAKKYDLCDTCSFTDINLYGLKNLLRVVVHVMYKYPRIRSKMCFIGTHHGMENKVKKLEAGDMAVAKDFNIHYICSQESTIKLGQLMGRILAELIEGHNFYLATSVSAFGLLDAVLLDKNDYEGYAYINFVNELRRSESQGCHPRGCGGPESVIYHELGHILDYLCNINDSEAFLDFYNSLSAKDILTGLSEYATSSSREFIAEAFAECMCNPTPRPIAVKMRDIIDRAYKRLEV